MLLNLLLLGVGRSGLCAVQCAQRRCKVGVSLAVGWMVLWFSAHLLRFLAQGWLQGIALGVVAKGRDQKDENAVLCQKKPVRSNLWSITGK